jgi:2-polyprenyl-3-methyl-5-hydroxy-6-metoxy-1,4-benzoquinol methylase
MIDDSPEIYGRRAIANIVRSLPPIERAYSLVRFSIMRPQLLSVMDLLLTDEGRVLDVGCGFGLFAAYFGQMHRRRRIVGVDPDARCSTSCTICPATTSAGSSNG